MILSLFVYTFSAIILYLLAKNMSTNKFTSHSSSRTSSVSTAFIFTVLYFAAIAGIRSDVGVDYGTYSRFYTDIQTQGWTDRESLETGFYFVLNLFAKTGLHSSLFFALWGALQILFVYCALVQYKQILPYIALAIMLGPFFLEWMNGIRQATVCCIFVYVSHYIVEKKFWKYVVAIFLASTIHKSALLLLPLYFFSYSTSYLSNRYVNIGVLMLCVILGSNSIWGSSLPFITNLFQLLGYDYYAENFDVLLEDTREMSWGPVRILLFIRDVLIIWFYPKVISFFNRDKWISLSFTLFYWGTCLYNLLVLSGIIFTRPLMYLRIFALIMIGFTIYYLFASKRRTAFYLFGFICFSYIYISHFKLYASGVLDSPLYYKFFFSNENPN